MNKPARRFYGTDVHSCRKFLFWLGMSPDHDSQSWSGNGSVGVITPCYGRWIAEAWRDEP